MRASDLVEHVRRLAVVDLARGADQPGLLGRGVDDEPRIDGDAVAADARARLQDVDARVAVGEPDHLPDVDAELVADHRQLVGEGDVDVAVGVLDELGHLGGARRRCDAGSPRHEDAVELGGALPRSAA